MAEYNNMKRSEKFIMEKSASAAKYIAAGGVLGGGVSAALSALGKDNDLEDISRAGAIGAGVGGGSAFGLGKALPQIFRKYDKKLIDNVRKEISRKSYNQDYSNLNTSVGKAQKAYNDKKPDNFVHIDKDLMKKIHKDIINENKNFSNNPRKALYKNKDKSFGEFPGLKEIYDKTNSMETVHAYRKFYPSPELKNKGIGYKTDGELWSRRSAPAIDAKAWNRDENKYYAHIDVIKDGLKGVEPKEIY